MTPLKGALRRYDISVRVDPHRGGEVSAKVHGDDAATLKLSACRHILLLVHGFNDTAEQAAAAYQQMIDLLQPDLLQMNEPDAIVCFQWPGDYAMGPLEQADFLGYPEDISRARQAAPVLLTYLRELCAIKRAGFKISIIAHSMGCRLILEMLNGCRALPLPIAVIALMAAAVPVSLVDNQWTGNGGPYLVGTDAMTRAMLKFTSKGDWVLWAAFPAGESLAYAMKKEPAEFLEAVGYLGDPWSFAEQSLARTHGHSEYWSDQDVEKMIVAVLGAVVPKAIARATIPTRLLSPAKEIAVRAQPSARSIGG
jgi:pimeloyl-ACP methyl ester carboxylesterase